MLIEATEKGKSRMNANIKERRSTNRWRVNRPCSVKLEGAEGFATCTLKDINLKGMRLGMGMRLPKDTFLKLSLCCHETCMLDVEVWPAWQKSVSGGYQYGFYFAKISDEDREKVFRFVRDYYPKLIEQRWWQGETVEEGGGEEMEDNRIFERVSARFPIRYLDPRRGQEGEAELQDVSAKGIGFLSHAAFSQKADIEMWIKVPDNTEPLYTRGEVVWPR